MARIVIIVAALGVVSALTMCEEKTAPDTQGQPPRPEPTAPDMRTINTPLANIGSVASCRALLQEDPGKSDRARRTRKILGDHVHWQGAPHQIFPKRVSVQGDIDAAFDALDGNDLPILVSLIGTGELGDGELGLAGGVLTRFGPGALPCIEAGISLYRTQRATDLSAIKINIEVQPRAPTAPRSNPP